MARNRIYKEQTTTTTYRHPITAKEGLDKVVNDFLSPLRVDFVAENGNGEVISFELKSVDVGFVKVPKEALALKSNWKQIDKISGATLEKWEGETELYRIKRYKKNEGWKFEYFATELEGRDNLK